MRSFVSVMILLILYSPFFIHSQNVPPASIIDFIINRYHSGSVVQSIRDRMPSRSGSTDQFDYNDSNYYQGIAKLAIPGILFAGLSFFALVIYSCYRCCCAAKNTSGPQRSKTLLIIALLLSIISFVFIVVGLAYNEKTTDAISGDNGIVDNGKGLLDGTIKITNEINFNLNTVSNETNYLAPTLQSRLNPILTAMSTGISSLDTTLSSTSSTINSYSSITVSPYDPADPNFNQPINFPCGNICSTTIGQINNYQNVINNNVNPLYNTIQSSLIPSIQRDIISASSTIISAIQSARAVVTDVNQQAKDHQSTTNDAADQTNQGDKNRRWVMIVLFIIPLLCTLLLFIGLFCRSSLLLKSNRILLSLFVPLLFLTFATHMALTALSADSCHYFDQREITLRGSFNSNTAAVIEACLVGNSILDALNIYNPINSINNVTIPPFPDATNLLNTSQWSSINTQASSLSPSSFGLTPSVLNSALNDLNQLTVPDIFTFDTAINCDYTRYSQPSSVRTAKNRLLTQLNAQKVINSAINNIQGNFSSFNNALTTSLSTINNVQGQINGLQSVLTPLLNAVFLLENSAYCGSLGNRYLIMKQKLCGSSMDQEKNQDSIALSIGILTIACLFIAVASFLLIIIANRAENTPGDGFEEDHSAQLNPLKD